jgi:ribosomal protein L37E
MSMSTDPIPMTETPDEQRRCRCGRELVRSVETETCIACGRPESTCACGPND